MKIYAYVRTSTGQQGMGIHTQYEICHAHAHKNGYQIEKFFKDENVRGVVPIRKRAGLSAAISTLSKGDILLVVRRDRLGRNTELIQRIQEAIEVKGAKILSTYGEGTESDDSCSLAKRNLADSFAEYEHRLISCRTFDAMQAKKSRGERVGHIPFGFRLAQDRLHLEEEPQEQEVLRQMCDLRASGLSLRKIASRLNDQGKFNRGSAIWNHASTLRILNRNHATACCANISHSLWDKWNKCKQCSK